MSNAIIRFRAKKSGAVKVTVPWAIKEGDQLLHEFQFEVNLFAQAELNEAQSLAGEICANRGQKEPKPVPSDQRSPEQRKELRTYLEFLNLEYFYQVALLVKRHIVGWTHVPHDGSEPEKFSKGAVELLFQEMDRNEATLIGTAFMAVRATHYEKKSGEVTSTPNSLNGFEAASGI